jgi:hypothetical protein
MSCKYQKHVKYQEGRIRYLELELKAAKEEINLLRNGNMSNKIKNKNISGDFWMKPKNSKCRAGRFSADDVSHIRLSNKFSILEVDQQCKGLLEHEDIKTKSLMGKSKSQKKKILLLGSSHGQDIGPMLQKHLGSEYEVTSVFKPDAPLANVIEDLENLSKDLTKKDHIVIVGGPENSLDSNYNYSIEKDLNSIAMSTGHTNVRFVGLLKRHDNPWMNRKVRSVNLRLDHALLGQGMSHVGVIDTLTFRREEFTNHGLHLNSRGKRRLTLLIADGLNGGHVSGISSIPGITHARASPFLD